MNTALLVCHTYTHIPGNVYVCYNESVLVGIKICVDVICMDCVNTSVCVWKCVC